MRKSAVSILLSLMLCVGRLVCASEFYEWTDEAGVSHFADSLEQVPAKYRSQLKAPASPPKPTAASSVPSGATPAVAPPAPADRASATRKRFEVPYQNESGARRIIIPVTFNDAVTAPMALDTGAPGLMVSVELAERLGIFSHDSGTLLVAAGGVGGTTPGVLSIVDSVTVQGVRSVFVPATITRSLSPAFQGLVGMDFLAGYTVSIDSKRQVVVFEQDAPDPSSRGGHDEGWWRDTFKEFRATRDRWSEYGQSLEHADGSTRFKPFAAFQAREAERLLQRLDLYASDNAVPQHWR